MTYLGSRGLHPPWRSGCAITARCGIVAPAAVVIDTLNRSLNGSENSDEDMSNFVKAPGWPGK